MMSRLTLCLWLLLFLLTTRPLCAQILNIEKARVDRDTSDIWIGSLGFNLNIFNRNAGEDDPRHFINLGIQSNVGYLSGQHGYLLMGRLDYVEVTDDPLIRTGYAHGRITLKRSKTWSYELFGQFQYDISRGMRSRWLTGGGLRWRIRSTDATQIFAGSGIMYEVEKWQDPTQEGSFLQPELLKTTNYLSIHSDLNSHVRLDAISYYQGGYDGSVSSMRHRLNLTTSINVRLTNKLNLKTSFDCQFENRPIIPITKFIYAISNGLTYSF